jgi:energy-coupling factor transport system substrate-specific component
MSLRRIPPEVLRFLVAGSLAAGLNWLVRFPLSMALPFGAAVALSYAIGMTAGFVLYRRWVFAGSSISPVAQFTRFVAVNAVTALIVLAAAVILAGGLQQMGLSMQWAEACGHATAIAIGAGVNFFGHKFVSFAGRAPA